MATRLTEPIWLNRVVVDAIQTDQIREHGGLAGLRDKNALESALSRARHQWLYRRTTDLASLAAAYGFGLARDHPYIDGNKRVALVTMLTFLALNGYDVDAEDDDVLTAMIAVAAGKLAETDLAAWLRARMIPVK